MSGKGSRTGRTSTKIKSGIDLIAKYRKQANDKGLSMFVGHRWNENHRQGVAIWLHAPGESRTDADIVASADNLDQLYGR